MRLGAGRIPPSGPFIPLPDLKMHACFKVTHLALHTAGPSGAGPARFSASRAASGGSRLSFHVAREMLSGQGSPTLIRAVLVWHEDPSRCIR